jgi:hypothetical protein
MQASTITCRYVNFDSISDIKTIQTLAEFKAQWMIVLQRRDEILQLFKDRKEKAELKKANDTDAVGIAHPCSDRAEGRTSRKKRRMLKDPSVSTNSHSQNVLEVNSKLTNEEDDPFDCHHLVKIPSSHELIDTVVDEVIAQWRALDQRKIAAGTQLSNESNNVGQSLPKWYEKHVRLPEQFDYATIQSEPPHDDGVTGDRVIDFFDPTRTLSYHTELWKLFANIPTRQQLEESVCSNHQLPNTDKSFQHINGIVQGHTSCSTTQWDQYGLSRFRMNDRHDLPLLQPTTMQNTKQQRSNVDENKYCGLIRFECLRKQVKRTSTPDPNRMVIEFLGSHTLYDVHRTIVELTDDELWYYYGRSKNTYSSNGSATNNNTNGDDTTDDGTGRNNNDEDNNNNDTEIDCSQQNGLEISSGYFFIENTFYIAGSVDYTTPILQWIQSGTKHEQKRRMEHLGIGPTLPNIRPMNDMLLYNLPTRLGIRYVHVHQGDVECAIFVTDRRLMLQQNANAIQFPIIHDIWTPSYSIPDCDACQNRVAVIATSTECTITHGHKALCEVCSRQLQLQVKARNHIERYTVWRGQADLSAGASNETTW